jgi:UDP-glucuronate 4-epimerase
MKILVTGGAGFIGSAVAKRLVDAGHEVVVLDNFNEYYDVELKRARVKALIPNVLVVEGDVTDKAVLSGLMEEHSFDAVAHLAAQAGVRYSLEYPEVYVHSNVVGTQTLLEVMKEHGVKNMIYASTSSAYGNSSTVPFSETEAADKPVSIYAATKRAGELIAHTYCVLHEMNITCLRFFTVYGSWGRPDMALFKFTDAMLQGEAIDVYNNGQHRRDFTYIDDIVSGFVLAIEKALPGYEIINLGNGHPVELMEFIAVLEKELGVPAQKNFLPMQEGDVLETFADITKARTLLGFVPQTDVEVGVGQFSKWYRSFYNK